MFAVTLLNLPRVDADGATKQVVVVVVGPPEQGLERMPDGRLACAHHPDEQDAIRHLTCEGTNGGLTTCIVDARPRTSTVTVVPSPTDRSSSARPMPTRSV